MPMIIEYVQDKIGQCIKDGELSYQTFTNTQELEFAGMNCPMILILKNMILIGEKLPMRVMIIQ